MERRPSGQGSELDGAPSLERWIDDHRSVGAVPWPDGVRDELRLLRRGSLAGASLGCPVALILLVLALLLLVQWTPSRSGHWLLLPCIVLPAIAWLYGRDHRTRRRAITRALRCEALERFEIAEHVEEESRAAAALGAVGAMPEQFGALLVASPAGMVVRVGDRTRSPTPVTIRLIQHYRTSLPAVGAIRPLTDWERNEVRRHARHIASTPWLVVTGCVSVGMLAGLAIFVGHWIGTGTAPTASQALRALMTAAFLVFLVRARPHIKAERQFRRSLGRDARDGLLETVDGATAVADLVARHGRDARPTVTPTIVTRLQRSGVWWEIDGTPASWRRIGR